MDDPDNYSSQTADIKNVLPDVVHSQQIPTVGVVEADQNIDTGQNAPQELSTTHNDDSKTESISEDVPSKCEYSTDSESDRVQGLLTVDNEHERVSRNSSLNLPLPHSSLSENQNTQNPSKLSTSWPLDMNADVHLISEESPVNLALSSDREVTCDNTPDKLDIDKPEESPRSDHYLDSLNKSDNSYAEEAANISDNEKSLEKSTESEEIIKLDIRGQGMPKFPFPAAKIIFGPPPEGSEVIDANVDPLPVFPNLLSPFLVGAGDTVKVEEVFENDIKEPSPDKSLDVTPDKSICSDKIEQSDLLIEEITLDDELKEKESEGKESLPPKSIPVEEASFSTLTTDYKTICEEYHGKLVHLEDAITQRDQLIEELTVSLQRSVRERDDLQDENHHLSNEVQHLQHVVGEISHTDHDTIKAQLSDFVKYQSMVKDDTKFYSALMSGESSVQTSNSEKDMDREEITVNYSKSDLKSSDTSGDFQTGFESKITKIIDTFEECIEENLRNKLRESLIQVLCDEIGKMRIESDTDIKELETQMQQDKQEFTVETRRLRELLASVKSGNADIEALREELGVKHEKEMENLRTYFEKKCSDMERSYSEEVWRGKCQSPLGSASSLDGAADAAGDYFRRRTRSAELPSLSLESTPMEQAARQISKKYEQQLDEMKAEHVAYVDELQARQREAIASLEDQITQLKAHMLTTGNTEANVSLYQQDIDLELEKKMEAQLEQRLEEVREQARREVVAQLEEQLQVLLSDPDAEVSSWPLELVALRDRIQGDCKTRDEREVSSLRDEVSAYEDKWKQRRNHSFDQNRHLEEVTRERDDLKRVAVSLHRVVGQLVAYCACAEDELNRTVLTHLLGRLLPGDADESALEEEFRPSTPSLSGELNASAVSRHVHFAPDLNAILTDLDEECIVGFLQQQRDLSADIKRELEHSLRRLRHEAHELLHLSAKGKSEQKMLESSVSVTEMVQDLDDKSCDNCELHRKSMEEAMAECLQRENLLRSDLEAAMIKIAQLMTSADVIAEGYGTGGQVHSPQPSRRTRGESPRSPDTADTDTHARELHALQRERDDLHQQLEAANRQLRSTRQFVEEQAGEREAERDEFARTLADLRDENTRLAARLQNNARILNEMHCLRLAKCNCLEHDAHVEQLEAQTREMNQIINELETRKVQTDDELKVNEEKIVLLRDIIANLEGQLEQKVSREKEILEELEEMKRTIDERDGRMRGLLSELESLKNEKADQSEVVCSKCGLEEEKYTDLLQRIKEQCHWLEETMHRRTRKLEHLHEICSTSCSEPSEDVSIRDQKNMHLESKSEESVTPRVCGGELRVVWEALGSHARAEGALLKRLADLEMQRNSLKDLAQEVRAERDVLQARMSEQALRISSLSARLQQQRNDAEALSHQATSQLTVQLHDALAEVQRLKEELDSKDKQLTRLKQHVDERDRLQEQHHSLYGNSCNPKDKVMILERELSSAQTRIAQLESLARSLEKDKEDLQTSIRDYQRELAEKEEQLQELLALKLDEDNHNDENVAVEGKTSARTLSDIVSISEFDEQDLQMRRAEIKAHNVSLTDAPYPTELRDKTLNRTLPPELQRPNMSSLNIECTEHFELPSYTPRADSLPAHLTSTQNKDIEKPYKRNVNEVTMFGAAAGLGDVHATAQKITDNCSMYPNRDVDDTKNISVEPKKINFSLEATSDKEEFTSLRELGITLDIKQENFPDILSQLKHEIKKSRSELETCKSNLKNAEEQLCEFPALKEEVEELKGLLENTMTTMESDKQFYENQLENFVSSKKLLEKRVSELTNEVTEGSKNLHLLKEDILRRENMILELAKEKRNLTNRIAELEVKIDELQSKNAALEKFETENHQMKEKIVELQKLENLVSEKNQQIDSLNQHLDRLDDLQRCLHDKTEEINNLNKAVQEKTNEVFHLQSTVESVKRDVSRLNEENDKLNTDNKELKHQLTKLEKEQENALLKLQNSESELERVNSLNEEMNLKIQELKLLTDELKDKETEIEILNEDINAFHEEIATLKEQLKMASRSPSPRKSGEEKKVDRQASSDKKQLVKIRKQISLLQHELEFNKKELNDKAFELAKAKLDVTELKNTISQATKQSADKEFVNLELRQQMDGMQREIHELKEEKQKLEEQLEFVTARLREECNVSELRAKLRQKSERCEDLENELQDLKELVERLEVCESQQRGGCVVRGECVARSRSPTAELERAVRDQLHYSHQLDDTLVDQILSASSDEHEDIPPLALNTSKSSSSIHSTSSDRINRLKSENEKLLMQVDNLESRLKDKDALITELNRVREKLSSESQTSRLRYEAERDAAGRLRLLLHAHKDTADTLQNQDSNMIQILKRRLESAMQSEVELQQQAQQLRARVAALEHQLASAGHRTDSYSAEIENMERLKGSVTVLKSKLEVERSRCQDLQATLEHSRLQAQRELDARADACRALRDQLAETKRHKHDTSVELVRAKELLSTQSGTIIELEKKLTSTARQKPINDALTEIQTHKSELAREIATLKRCLADTASPELQTLRSEKQQLTAKVEKLEAELQQSKATDEKEQAIRYLHGRCLRLESYRKALVWQKRYLQRVLEGYTQLEKNLCLPSSAAPPKSRGKNRFRCVARAVMAALRARYLVRRRGLVRALSAHALLRHDTTNTTTTTTTNQSQGQGVQTPTKLNMSTVPRQSLRRDLAMGTPGSPHLDFMRQSPYPNSPRDDPFILSHSSPRGSAAGAYLSKLELVGRCLQRATRDTRDTHATHATHERHVP